MNTETLTVNSKQSVLAAIQALQLGLMAVKFDNPDTAIQVYKDLSDAALKIMADKSPAPDSPTNTRYSR